MRKSNHKKVLLRYLFISALILVFAGMIVYNLFMTTVVHADDWNRLGRPGTVGAPRHQARARRHTGLRRQRARHQPALLYPAHRLPQRTLHVGTLHQRHRLAGRLAPPLLPHTRRQAGLGRLPARPGGTRDQITLLAAHTQHILLRLSEDTHLPLLQHQEPQPQRTDQGGTHAPPQPLRRHGPPQHRCSVGTLVGPAQGRDPRHVGTRAGPRQPALRSARTLQESGADQRHRQLDRHRRHTRLRHTHHHRHKDAGHSRDRAQRHARTHLGRLGSGSADGCGHRRHQGDIQPREKPVAARRICRRHEPGRDGLRARDRWSRPCR